MSNDGSSQHHGVSVWDLLRRTPVTNILIAASIGVTLATSLGKNLEILTWFTFADLHHFDRTLPSGFIGLQNGQLWRLLTPIFIHFSLMHILFNMMWLKDLGGLIERRWSSRHHLAIVVVSGVLSNVAQYLINWDARTGIRTANVLSGGMSGVVYALLGYLWIRGRIDPSSDIRVPNMVVWMMLGWLVLCTLGLLGSIGNTSHVVGLLVGVIWAWAVVWLARKPKHQSPEEFLRNS